MNDESTLYRILLSDVLHEQKKYKKVRNRITLVTPVYNWPTETFLLHIWTVWQLYGGFNITEYIIQTISLASAVISLVSLCVIVHVAL